MVARSGCEHPSRSEVDKFVKGNLPHEQYLSLGPYSRPIPRLYGSPRRGRAFSYERSTPVPHNQYVNLTIVGPPEWGKARKYVIDAAVCQHPLISLKKK